MQFDQFLYILLQIVQYRAYDVRNAYYGGQNFSILFDKIVQYRVKSDDNERFFRSKKYGNLDRG